MQWQVSVYALALFAAAGIMLVALMFVWPRRRAIGGRPLAGLLLAAILWSVGYAFEAMATTVTAKVVFGTIGYPGALAVPVFFFLFVVEYTQSEKWAPRPRWHCGGPRCRSLSCRRLCRTRFMAPTPGTNGSADACRPT